MSEQVGSLCTGTGALDGALVSVLGGVLAWYAEIEPAACRLLEHHHPGVPNLGDLKTVDWEQVPLVRYLTAGYPCQPFSHAGRREGEDDPRHLWPYVKKAIRVLRPEGVFLENVEGHLSLGFDTVLGDLAEIGYDARWILLPASGVGAPHRRRRVFVWARPSDSDRCDPDRLGASGLAR